MATSTSAEQTTVPRWRIVGPGLVVAATGVGAADMVATLVAGRRYGYGLLWAVILGVIMKIVLVEGAGRFSLATGKTIFEGWRSLGRWTTWYFGPYIMIWGFVYGATAMSSAALPLAASSRAAAGAWAILMGLVGFVMVWFGQYAIFEKITAVLVGLMFVTVVGLAVIAAPNIPEMLAGLVPMIPRRRRMFYTLALAGGVGGTITLAAYGYWLREKGWYTPKWMRVMRIDNSVAYVITGIFVIAMLIVGAEVLAPPASPLERRRRGPAGPRRRARGPIRRRGRHRLPGRLLGGIVLLHDRRLERRLPDVRRLLGQHAQDGVRPPGHPRRRQVLQVLRALADLPADAALPGQADRADPAYGALGSLFMPFLALTLLGLLNGKRIPKEWANKLHSNVLMAIIALAFVALCVNEVRKAVAGV